VYGSKSTQSAFVLDVFAGCGGVAKACFKLGRESYIVDNTWNANFNACSSSFMQWLKVSCAQGCVASVMIATPCSSFSLAVSRSGKALRSKTHPRGLPVPLTAAEQPRITNGNIALDSTIQMIETCNANRVPYVLENPMSSYLWSDQALCIAIAGSVQVCISQCAFRAKWRKDTRLAFGNFGMR
jgi:hypothetical protein